MKTLKISTILSIAGIILLSSCQKEAINPSSVTQVAPPTVSQVAPTVVPDRPTITGDTVLANAPNGGITLTAHSVRAQSYVWFKNLIPVAGQTDSTLTVKEPGDYRVQGVNVIGTGSRSSGFEVK